MAEAIAAVGLVASIITLVDLGAKVVSRVNNFVAQTADVPQSFRSLADRLPLLITTLQHIRVRAQAGTVPDDVVHGLCKLVNSAAVEVRFLEECLEKITPATDASRFAKSVKGLQSLMKDEKVKQAAAKIDSAINVLVLNQLENNIHLTDRVLHQLAGLKIDSTPLQQTFGLHLGRAPRIAPDAFLGRTDEIEKLHDLLMPTSGNLNCAQQIVSVVGMGGLGKTQLSLAYVHRHAHQFSSVFWLSAKDKVSLQKDMSTLSAIVFDDGGIVSSMGDEQRQVERVQRWLSEPSNNQWLLIFDNYDDPALPNARSPTGFDIRTFFPSRAQGHILITTRSPKLMFSQRLMLEPLRDLETGIAILAQRSGRDLAADEDARVLAARLSGLPLALAVAGTYMGETGASCRDYQVLYDELWNDLHGPDSAMLFEYEDRTLSSTWLISFDQVSRQDADAAELLKFFAFLDNQDVWYDLIKAGVSEGPAWIERLTTTKVRFDGAMSKLRDYSLVEVVPGSYRIHPCIHDWLFERFHQTPDEMCFLTALNCVRRSVPIKEDADYWATSRRLLGHVQRLEHTRFSSSWQALCLDFDALDASHAFAGLHYSYGQLHEAELMYERALAGREKLLGVDHSVTIETVNNLGLVYIDRDKLADAERMFTRALAVSERDFGPADVRTLVTVHNLGLLYRAQGKLAKAEEMYSRALTCETILGPTDSSTLITVNNLGSLYAFQERLAEAEQMYTRALTGREQILGPGHISTLHTVNDLGILYYKQHKMEQAERMFKRALAGYEAILGPNGISTLHVITNLGLLYQAQSKLEEAEQLLIRAISGYEKILGADHTSTLDAVNNLGTLYRGQGRLAEAEHTYTRALAGYEKAANLTSAAYTTYNFGNLYASQGKTAEAEQMYMRSLAAREAILGPDHLHTLDTLSNLGVLYQDQGRLADAERLYTRALAGYQKTVGPDHSSTQQAIRNLHTLTQK